MIVIITVEISRKLRADNEAGDATLTVLVDAPPSALYKRRDIKYIIMDCELLCAVIRMSFALISIPAITRP